MAVAGQPMEGATKRPWHSHGRAVTAWTLWAVSVVFVVISLAATARSGGPDDPSFLPAISFATVGAILVTRLPGNVIGWLLAAGGLCFALTNGATGLADLGLSAHPGSVPGAIWFAWLSQWIWAPSMGAVVGLALVYPTGRLLSRRWRPVALAAVLVIALLTFGAAVGPWPTGMFPVQNPLQVGGEALGLLNAANVLLGPIAVVVALLAVASLVIRYRRGAGIERAQLRWFAAVAVARVLKGRAGRVLRFAPTLQSAVQPGWARAVVAFTDPTTLDFRAQTIAWHVTAAGVVDPERYQQYPGTPQTLAAMLAWFDRLPATDTVATRWRSTTP